MAWVCTQFIAGRMDNPAKKDGSWSAPDSKIKGWLTENNNNSQPCIIIDG
jgi:hypothetical protein